MAASFSSSSSPLTWRHHVFTSFHGPDVRKTFISHLRRQFNVNAISMFDDQGIERGETISPALIKAIKGSRISIVVLSKNYASSSWCLDELLEIFKCKEAMGQIVLTVFYEVNPAHVREQTGEFGIAFNKTCARKTKEKRGKWSQALKDAGNIAGEHFERWPDESKMIEKIAQDVSNRLTAAVCRDFDDKVGIEAHLRKMQSLLHLDCEDESIIVGICGPAGIGKTTIARALHSRLSNSFQLTCFMENIRGSKNSDLDEHGLKLFLQEKLLSKILNQKFKSLHSLDAIARRLCHHKVLIILDDVDEVLQLEALANDRRWFGRGSRIIVTTEDQKLLEKHCINNIYHVDFPTKEEAHKIFCTYAFKKSSAPDGFEKLVERVTKLCSNLPLGLCVMGRNLCQEKEDDWERILRKLENSLDQNIEKVLRVGYDKLDREDQLLFLFIAFFLNYKNEDHMKAMLGDSNLDVTLGLKNLKYRSLIQISTKGEVVMHKLLEQVGIAEVQKQDPRRRPILNDINDFCGHVLDNNSDSRPDVRGISFDISKLENDVWLSAGALKSMCNLRFLKIYKTRSDKNVTVHVPEEMDFPTQLRLFHWEKYPGMCLPNTFRPEYLVEFNMENNKLEKLWEGIQPLTNLKKMNLSGSFHLKELPDLSKATKLEKLDLVYCTSLVEIPSSIGKLYKLVSLNIRFCLELQVFPTDHIDLASLDHVDMLGCRRLRKFPDTFKNIRQLTIVDTMLEDLLGSIRVWYRLVSLTIFGSAGYLGPEHVEFLSKESDVDIERIPDSIKDLHELVVLQIYGCRKLASLPELPRSLRILTVNDCESLETLIPFPFIEFLRFCNCFKLGQEARRVITHQSETAWLPGRNIPAEFDHRGIGNSLTIPVAIDEFRICLVISSKQSIFDSGADLLLCRIRSSNGDLNGEKEHGSVPYFKTKHLYIYHDKLPFKLNEELMFEFITTSQDTHIIEYGFQILTTHGSTSSEESYESRILQDRVFEEVEDALPRISSIESVIENAKSEVGNEIEDLKGRIRELEEEVLLTKREINNAKLKINCLCLVCVCVTVIVIVMTMFVKSKKQKMVLGSM